ncbi:hypothetical protein ACLI4R_06630 [Natrialbaceae archaeon A-chndr2]
MHELASRRRFLTVCATGGTIAVAGCTDESATDENGVGDTQVSGTIDGGSGGESGSDEPATESGDDESSSTESSDDGGDSTDATDDGADVTDDEADSPNGTDDDSVDETDDPLEEYDRVDGGPSIGSLLTWDTSYTLEFEMRRINPGQFAGPGEQVAYEGDFHHTIETESGDVEFYGFGDVGYYVHDGHCSRGDVDDIEPHALDPDRRPDAIFPETEPAAETTIDGESVYVYEMPASPANTFWYLEKDTGYPVRFDSERITAEFDSWNQTSPISPPDMECED